MKNDVIITCAVTGAGETFHKNPDIPVTPEQVTEAVISAAKAGAAVAHIHVRDPETKQGSRDVELFRQVVEAVRASDLMSPYVGETEARISAAFRRCGEAGTLLLLDEADSFLFDRQGATRSWESGMVNEMLRSMEALRAPFIATTNLIDRMDPATQRRFTLRVSFQSLPRQQVAALFARYFDKAMPEPLAEGLTPGDFAVVAHRARLLGEARPEMLYDWLVAERNARGPERGRMGFCPDGMA